MPQALFDKIFGGSKGVNVTLLDLFGISATFTHIDKGKYDPLLDQQHKSVIEKVITISPILRYSAYEIANLHIEKDDAKILANGEDFNDIEIKNTVDFFVVNGEKWMIVRHEKVYSGNKCALIKFQVRKQVK